MLVNLLECCNLFDVSDVGLNDLADQLIVVLPLHVDLVLHLFGNFYVVVVVRDHVHNTDY